MDNHTPIYNSRLINIYVKYLIKNYPDIDINDILAYSEIKQYELNDEGHWLSQHQVNRFHEILTEKTKDPHIARKVGRFAASSSTSGIFRQFALGLLHQDLPIRC